MRDVSAFVDAGAAVVALARPPRNALTAESADELVAVLRTCAADPEVRAVVLTGEGPAFSVGADLTEGPDSLRALIAADGGRAPGYREPAGRVTAALAALEVPVVAAVQGDAVGGGATITLAADVRFVAESARFGFPFTRLGVCPEGASTFFLPRLVGPSIAADWLLSGRLVDSAEALRTGLASRVLPAAEVLPAALAWVRDVAAHTSPAAVARTRALLAASPTDADAAAAAESAALVALVDGPDCPEGIAAFLARRPPRFAARGTLTP